MGEWKCYRLADVTINHDSRRVAVKSADRRPGPFPYYGASGIVDSIDSYLFDGEYLLIAEDGENLRTRKTPIAFMASGNFWVNNHAHVVQGNSLVHTRYLEYVLSQTDISGYLSGSTQPKLTQAALNGIEVALPARDYQDVVIRLLGALDDKIAVNERIADISDHLAAALASPGLQNSTCTLQSVATLSKKQVAPSSLDDSRVAHYSLPAFDSGQVPEHVAPIEIKSNKFVVDHPSVLLAKLNPATPRIWCMAPLGFTALASTEFLVLQPVEGVSPPELWAVCNQQDLISQLVGRATGTSNSHQRVRPAEVLASEVVDPRELPDRVREQVQLAVQRGQSARLESVSLVNLRDMLLPKLMSGELRVRDAERAVEEAT